MEYLEFRNARKEFLEKNKRKDHAFVLGSGDVLLSAPHGVSQVRLGKRKVQESGSLCTALLLQQLTNSHLIAKTKNNFDDANFDPACEYRTSLDEFVMSHNIKYVVDIHGLASFRDMDINLGTNLGRNIESDVKIFDDLADNLKRAGFVVSVDQPFSGDIDTIAGSTKQKHKSLWTIQIEINSNLTNKKQNIKRFLKLVSIIENWIENIKNK